MRVPSTPGRESLRRPHGLLPIATLLLSVTASVVTHVAGSGPVSGGSGEAGEAAEQSAILLPPLLGPFGSVLLIGAIWLARRRPLNRIWFFLVPPLAFGSRNSPSDYFTSRVFRSAAPSRAC